MIKCIRTHWTNKARSLLLFVFTIMYIPSCEYYGDDHNSSTAYNNKGSKKTGDDQSSVVVDNVKENIPDTSPNIMKIEEDVTKPVFTKVEKFYKDDIYRKPIEKIEPYPLLNKFETFFKNHLFFGVRLNLYYVRNKLFSPDFVKDLTGEVSMNNIGNLYVLQKKNTGKKNFLPLNTYLLGQNKTIHQWTDVLTDNNITNDTVYLNNSTIQPIGRIADDGTVHQIFGEFSQIFLMPSILMRISMMKSKKFNIFPEFSIGTYKSLELTAKLFFAMFFNKLSVQIGTGYLFMSNCYIETNNQLIDDTNNNSNTGIFSRIAPVHRGSFSNGHLHNLVFSLRILERNSNKQSFFKSIKKVLGMEFNIGFDPVNHNKLTVSGAVVYL